MKLFSCLFGIGVAVMIGYRVGFNTPSIIFGATTAALWARRAIICEHI